MVEWLGWVTRGRQVAECGARHGASDPACTGGEERRGASRLGGGSGRPHRFRHGWTHPAALSNQPPSAPPLPHLLGGAARAHARPRARHPLRPPRVPLAAPCLVVPPSPRPPIPALPSPLSPTYVTLRRRENRPHPPLLPSRHATLPTQLLACTFPSRPLHPRPQFHFAPPRPSPISPRAGGHPRCSRPFSPRTARCRPTLTPSRAPSLPLCRRLRDGDAARGRGLFLWASAAERPPPPPRYPPRAPIKTSYPPAHRRLSPIPHRHGSNTCHFTAVFRLC